MTKAILVAFLFFVLCVGPLHAQSKNTVKTKVGNPTGGTGASSVLDWGHQISDSLEAGFDNGYDKMVANITNGSYAAPQSPGTGYGDKYWCTYLVIDSFNLAGFTGLSRASGHGGVVYMLSWWRSANDYIFLDYYNDHSVLSQVQPGYSIMFQDNPGMTTIGDFDHAALVESISVNEHGDGSLVTLDSNLPTSVGRTVNYQIKNWDIIGTLREAGRPNYAVMGFGTKK